MKAFTFKTIGIIHSPFDSNENVMYLENLDIINGTPLLDIKPYIPDFDVAENIRMGWLAGSKHRFSSQKSDKRFDF
ncbi:MAG: TrmO family methyltransferase [Bacteroidales bacterium]